ncbi:SRPBCC family protein [Actinomadura adrarensis]|uniref:SRPBCC family protein n=1 Tax=Actinomadura adrarensis TaxID=1819600 RepID=A0ABW3CGN1_9ACTN
MQFETSVEIDAPMDKVWSILVDLERWPEMTPSVTSVERLEEAPLRVGSKAHLVQPRLQPSTWTVTELTEGESFVWESQGPGMVTIGGHYLSASTSGKVTARLTIDQKGMAAPLIGLLYGRLVRRYVTQEAEGLKRLAES